VITVNSRRYDGTIRRSWTCELIEYRDPAIVLVGEFAFDVNHSDLGHVPTGTISHEYYWLDRWYNIFRFHHPSGELRYFYCNINTPPTFDGEVLDYIDLDLDVLVQPDMTYRILDREDYERNSAKYGYPDEVKLQVESALEELIEVIEGGGLLRLT
jgi:protein associated with RNAse G/E